MKIKNLLSFVIALILSSLLVSCGSNDKDTNNDPVVLPPTKAELMKAISDLNKFGKIIASGNISESNKGIITSLAQNTMRVPIPDFIRIQGVLAAAHNPNAIKNPNTKKKNLMVLNTITGQEITDCKHNCTTKAIPPNDDVRKAIDSQKPIKGYIMKNGVRTEAWYIVSVKALYEGSKCETYYSGGSKYEDCFTFPFPPFPQF